MKAHKKIIKNGLIVTPSSIVKGNLLINGERIETILDKIPSNVNAEIYDAEGSFILPGGIDAHTHFDLEVKGEKTQDGFEKGTRAAILGGTTTIIDYAHQEPLKTLHECARYAHKKMHNKCYTDYAFHIGITDYNEKIKSELSELPSIGIISIKCYTTYDGLRLSYDKIEEIIKICKKARIVCNIHCEDDEIIRKSTEKLSFNEKLSLDNYPSSRPEKAEITAIEKLIKISKKLNYPVYIVHISTGRGIEKIHGFKKNRLKMFAETCPQYLILDEDRYKLPGKEAAKYILSPPLRTTRDIETLWKHLDSTIDVVATDHCSFNFRGQKDLDDFTKIPGGIPGVLNRISLLYTFGVRNKRIDIARMVQLVSENPARIFGLYPKKGVLAAGSDADIVVFDHRKRYKVRSHPNCDYSPYEGLEVYGRAKFVFLRGNLSLIEDDFIGVKGEYINKKFLFL